jgi:hypothetical protein
VGSEVDGLTHDRGVVDQPARGNGLIDAQDYFCIRRRNGQREAVAVDRNRLRRRQPQRGGSYGVSAAIDCGHVERGRSIRAGRHGASTQRVATLGGNRHQLVGDRPIAGIGQSDGIGAHLIQGQATWALHRHSRAEHFHIDRARDVRRNGSHRDGAPGRISGRVQSGRGKSIVIGRGLRNEQATRGGRENNRHRLQEIVVGIPHKRADRRRGAAIRRH